MSDQTHPVVMCDGEGGMCGAVELDLTLGGLGRIIGSESQLPDGWTGTKPGDGGEHYCPDCTQARADAARAITTALGATQIGADHD